MSAKESSELRGRAAQCRRLAKAISSRDVEQSLTALAEEYDRQAETLEVGAKPPGPTG